MKLVPKTFISSPKTYLITNLFPKQLYQTRAITDCDECTSYLGFVTGNKHI